MSYRDATELLKLLKGNGLEVSTSFGDEWAGGIKDIEYWSGPSEQNIRFVNEVDTKVMPSQFFLPVSRSNASERQTLTLLCALLV
jgi:hypothetical protein